jgi:hypothetical protein
MVYQCVFSICNISLSFLTSRFVSLHICDQVSNTAQLTSGPVGLRFCDELLPITSMLLMKIAVTANLVISSIIHGGNVCGHSLCGLHARIQSRSIVIEAAAYFSLMMQPNQVQVMFHEGKRSLALLM